MDSLVDVLMTVYNGSDHVEEAIHSVLNQTLKDFTLHVVDDGSTDTTPQILSSLASVDKRIVIHTRSNGGVVEASNYGLRFCKSDFVARADADDISFPERLMEQYRFFAEHPDVLAVGSTAYHITPDGRRTGTKATFSSPDAADTSFIPATEPYLLHPFLMVRREALEAIGGYRPLVVSEDTDLCWRLQERGKLVSDLGPHGEYRLNPNSISSKSANNGRIMAFYSQLAAMSAQRRRQGRDDLQFDEWLTNAARANAGSLEKLCAMMDDKLTLDEQRHLRFACGAKFIEMADYRPYEIESFDCIFLRAMFDELASSVTLANLQLLRRMYSGTAARLALQGRSGDAKRLVLPGAKFTFFFRILIRKLISPTTHMVIRQKIVQPLRRLSGR